MAGVNPTILVQETASYFVAKKREIDATNWQDRTEKRRAEKLLQEEIQDIFWEERENRGEMSFRHIAECTMGRAEARELWEDMRDGPLESSTLLENNAVDTGAFASISGQIAYTEIKAQFLRPEFIGGNLVTMKNTNFLDGEKIPGISMPADDFASIGESQPYPWVGVAEEYIETPRPVKRGALIGATREALLADRTGVLLDRIGQVGYAMGINREKRVIAGATGLGTATYKRNGNAAVATYDNSTAGTHPFDNLLALNLLQDYTDIENVFLAFDAITDPITGEPILIGSMDMLVPSALATTADYIKNATQVQKMSYTSAATGSTYPENVTASSIKTLSPNPLGSASVKGRTKIGEIFTSPYVSAISGGSSTSWFAGAFRQAFRYMSVWDVEVAQVPNSAELFNRDILFALKCGEFGVFAAIEPRYVVKCTS